MGERVTSSKRPFLKYPIKKVHSVEISGACNLEATCHWCPMSNRPRSRKRGLMSEETLKRALYWVETLDKVDALALHVFGEPLLHPKFFEYAAQFAALCPVTVSTNGVLLNEKMADSFAKIPWSWVSISRWSPKDADRAMGLLQLRGIKVMVPPGVTHSWAGQSTGPTNKLIARCDFLTEGKAVIRWDGSIASCCITDRDGDTWGHVNQEPSEIGLEYYDICSKCHHNVA